MCSRRSRLFLLKPAPPSAAKLQSPQGGSKQPKIDAMLRQLSAANSLPPDSNAAEAYVLAVRGCCTLMLQGRAGPAAVLAADAQRVLELSTGVGLQQLQRALQDHLLAPGSVCAEGVVTALGQELASIQQQAVIKVNRHV